MDIHPSPSQATLSSLMFFMASYSRSYILRRLFNHVAFKGYATGGIVDSPTPVLVGEIGHTTNLPRDYLDKREHIISLDQSMMIEKRKKVFLSELKTNDFFHYKDGDDTGFGTVLKVGFEYASVSVLDSTYTDEIPHDLFSLTMQVTKL